MKCEIVKDILPLYIDGLTSEETNQAVKEHIENCDSCQRYYQEMADALPEVMPKPAVEETKLIEREQKRRRKTKGLTLGVILVLCAVFGSILWYYFPSSVGYDDVVLTYGRDEKHIFASLAPKGNSSLSFSGYTEEIKDDDGKRLGSKSYLKLLAKHNRIGSQEESSENGTTIEAEISDEEVIYEWIFEFSDKIVTVRNGELVSEELR